MRDGPSVLAELQAGGVADVDLEYDTVIGELATARFPLLVLSPLRHQSLADVVLSPRQQDLIAKLVAIARATRSSREPPPEPDVAWRRIAHDLQRTTSRSLELTLYWGDHPEGGYWRADMEGRHLGRRLSARRHELRLG